MKRIKIVDSKINKEQLKVLAKISKEYAQGLVDFTTRENVQFHYIQIKDLPEIFKLLDSVGLTSRMASGDGPRPIVSCPVSRIDSEEIIDVRELVKKVDSYFNDNDDRFCNFPRKYKTAISGCSCHCAGHEIQDVAFTAFKRGEEVLFDLTVAGGLSKSKQIAYRTKRYVKESQVLDVTVAIAEIFRDNGNRDNRNKARVRHLVNEWGLEKFLETLEEKLGYALEAGEDEPTITPFKDRNHLGIHKAKQDGESFVGFATNGGRIAGEDFIKLSEIVEKYDALGVGLSTTQNFLVYGVKSEDAKALADEVAALGYPYEPSPFRANTQSCTGREFCKFGITETKNFAQSVVEHLESKFPNFNENLFIAISGCGNGCSHPQIADIGLVGTNMRVDGDRVHGYEVLVGGNLEGESKSEIATKVGLKIPATGVADFIESAIKSYLEDNKDCSSFKEYLKLIYIQD